MKAPQGPTYCVLGPVGLLASGKTDGLEEPGMEGQAPGEEDRFWLTESSGAWGLVRRRGQEAQWAERQRAALPGGSLNVRGAGHPGRPPGQQGGGRAGGTELMMLRWGGTGSQQPGPGQGEEPAGPGNSGPAQTSGVGGPQGGVRGSPRVRLSARAVWANSRPSWGVSVSASSADSLLHSRSSASRLPVDTARGSARS